MEATLIEAEYRSDGSVKVHLVDADTTTCVTLVFDPEHLVVVLSILANAPEAVMGALKEMLGE